MDKIPENSKDIRDILCKQMALLAEISNKYKCEPNLLAKLSHEMIEIANVLLS